MTRPTARMSWCVRGGLFATLMIAACRPDMAAWQRRLAEQPMAKLDGAWTIELRADSGDYGHESERASTSGMLAVVLNRERVTTSMFGDPPAAFGTYDIRLEALGLTTGMAAGTPDLWVTAHADTVVISLSPQARWPVTLSGMWSGDSVTGRWRADQRAGPGGQGNFTMRRR